MARRKLAVGILLGAASATGAAIFRRRSRSRARVEVYFADGSIVTLDAASPDAARAARARAPGARGRTRAMTDGGLAAALREHAYLEGDFVLRSGRRSTLLPRQVPLRDAARPARPARRADRGRGRADRARREAPRRPRARGGRARRGRVARGRPAVPDRAQGGEGVRDRRTGSRACSSRASASASSRTWSRPGAPRVEAVEALREAGLVVRHAVCVVDREEGGIDALARHGVRLEPLFRVSDLRSR